VKPSQDLLLQGQIKVDQDIAAEQQVDVRNGRVGGEITAPENGHVADLAAYVAGFASADEVFFPPLSRHELQFLGRVLTTARHIQGFLVHVGRVNLDVVPGEAVSEMLGQENGDAVGLLARG